MDPVTLAFVGFTVMTVGSLAKLHASKVEVPRVGRWKHQPKVLVSESFVHGSKPVEKAVKFWQDRGFAIGPVMSTCATSGCVPGSIFVGPIDQEWLAGSAGRATWAAEFPDARGEPEEDGGSRVTRAEDVLGPVDDGYIRYANIAIDPLLSTKLVEAACRHEIGHALGFLHCRTRLAGGLVGRKTGHVMHPLVTKCGRSTKGMKP